MLFQLIKTSMEHKYTVQIIKQLNSILKIVAMFI